MVQPQTALMYQRLRTLELLQPNKMSECNYHQIKDNPKLLRSNYSKAIINTDNESYEKYLIKKQRIMKEKKDMNSLRTEVSELKDLVKTLINKIG